jgi:hypothetical protein
MGLLYVLIECVTEQYPTFAGSQFWVDQNEYQMQQRILRLAFYFQKNQDPLQKLICY